MKIEFPVRQMASWSSEKGAYVLDGGDYVISLRTDSHTVVDQKTVSVTEKTFDTDEVTGTKLQNQFSDLTEYMEKNCKGELLSRADFKGLPIPSRRGQGLRRLRHHRRRVQLEGPRGLRGCHAHHRRLQRPLPH